MYGSVLYNISWSCQYPVYVELITVKDDVFDRFIRACDAAKVPNKKLREAKKMAQRKGIG
jgi:hypothetical protein